MTAQVAAPAEPTAPIEATEAAPVAEVEAADPANLNDVFEQVADKVAERNAKKKKGKKAKAAEAEAGPENEPEAPEDAEGEPEPTEGGPKPEDITADQLFTDDAISTPEGMRRAIEIARFAKKHVEEEAKRVESRSKKLDSFDIRLKKREKVVVAGEQKIAQQERIARAVIGELQIIAGARASDPMQILRSLDKLGGGNGSVERGRELFEAMSMAYARDGKLPEKTRGEAELERQIEALRQERLRERQEMEEQRDAQTLAQSLREVALLEANAGNRANVPQNPWISRYISEGRFSEADAGKWIGDLMHSEGLDLSSAIGILESRLVPPGTKPAPQGEPGAAPSKPRPNAKPALTTVLPTAADASSGSARELSPDERRARNARDPDFFAAWGLKHVAYPES
jgi:hypothetical protein